MQGYRLLVKAKAVETVTESGIILAIDEKLELSGQQFGTVVQIGHTCWCDENDNPKRQWCSVGDEILFSKYAGRFVYDPEDNEEYLVINDTDVIAVITEKDK
jgi:co-chaperonin GroES (HSP10)